MCEKGVKVDDLICIDLKGEDKDLKEEIEFAKHTAEEKSKGNRTYDKFKERTSFERFMNLFPGDLAKNLFRKELNKRFGINLVDYDKIREDRFEKFDLFDLKIEIESQEIEIEVKSSIEKSLLNSNKNKLIEYRRIIIYNERGIKDIIVQVLFVPKDEKCLKFAKDYGRINSGEEPISLKDFKELYSINNESDFIDFFINCMEACITGFITKEIAQEIHESMPFQPDGEEKREYLNIFIKDAFPINCFKKKIKSRLLGNNDI